VDEATCIVAIVRGGVAGVFSASCIKLFGFNLPLMVTRIGRPR